MAFGACNSERQAYSAKFPESLGRRRHQPHTSEPILLALVDLSLAKEGSEGFFCVSADLEPVVRFASHSDCDETRINRLTSSRIDCEEFQVGTQ
jgi:hypothetical protein